MQQLKALKQIRNEKKMTQHQVAVAAGIQQASYCRIENGERHASVATAKKIAAVLGIDWTWFFDD